MNYRINNIHKSYGNLKVLDGITLDFEENKVSCILGPSGCGKSTLLNILINVEKEDRGELVGFNGESISFVFQEDRLLEWKSVKDNIDFVLKDKMNKAEREKIIDKYLEAVDLTEYRDYYPESLSGGMRQRVSIARAFACKSNLLIMDEPFKSLDINYKKQIIRSFLEVKCRENRTVILVTHDIEEAILLGDNIVMFSEKPTRVRKVISNPISLNRRMEYGQEFVNLKKSIVDELRYIQENN